ncbi:MAG: fibronectin type III domain-containing protein, partial [Deltaproteobacteria bacterium]|nr:fibronectin type III domain-containing protein [Deltaproteobacteria bacterium]
MQIKKQIKYVLALLLIVFPTTVFAASVTLRWQPNSEPDISGYNLYYGAESREYALPIPVGNVSSFTVNNLVEGNTYYFSLTAVDTSGNESGYSYEVSANATSSEPATEDYRLSLSANSNRSNAVQLNDQTISGNVYIFIEPEAYISQVVFSIDGTTHNTENYAPYDLGLPFDTTTLSNGTHTISARIIDQAGSVQNIAETCTVLNDEDSTPVSATIIPLPSSNNYGMIKDGDQNHVDKVNYSFGGMSGNVKLSYRAWDIDNSKEVRVFLNGSPITYVSVTGNNQWSGKRVINLPDKLVNNSSENIVVFTNTYNPPKSVWWGVGDVSVVSDTPIPLPSLENFGMIKLGDQNHVDKVKYSFGGMSGNVKLSYRAWDIDNSKEVRVFLN